MESQIIAEDTISKIEALRKKYEVSGLVISAIRLDVKDRSSSPIDDPIRPSEKQIIPLGIADSSGKPMSKDTLFPIASNSKCFCALVMGILISRGTKLPNGEKLGWYTKIKSILLDFEMMDKYAEANIDISDLLSNRSGLPQHTQSFGIPDESASRLVHNVRYLDPSCSLRQHFQYFNTGFTIIGEIIHAITGHEYWDFATENLPKPLRMNSSTYSRTEAAESGRRIEGFAHYNLNASMAKDIVSKGEWDERIVGDIGMLPFWSDGDGKWNSAPGGVNTTGEDVLKYLDELLNPKIIPSEVIKEVNTSRSCFTPYPIHPELGVQGYGLGHVISSYRGHTYISHGGSLPGCKSQIARLPDHGLGICVVVPDETFGDGMQMFITHMILDDLLRLNKIDWEDRILLKSFRDIRLQGEVNKEATKQDCPSDKYVCGEFYDSGYGSITITPFNKHPLSDIYKVLMRQSPLNNIPGVTKTGDNMYIGDVKQDIAGHLLFTPDNGRMFNRCWVKAQQVTPFDFRKGEIIKSDKSVYAPHTYGSGKAVIDDHGWGMWDFVGYGQTVPPNIPDLNDVEGSSEVYFRRQ